MFSSPYRIANISKNEIIDLSYSIAEQRSMMYWGNTNTNKTYDHLEGITVPMEVWK